jgi:hypothetical protein
MRTPTPFELAQLAIELAKLKDERKGEKALIQYPEKPEDHFIDALKLYRQAHDFLVMTV